MRRGKVQFLAILLPLKRQKSLSANRVYFAIIDYSSYVLALYMKWTKVSSTELTQPSFWRKLKAL